MIDFITAACEWMIKILTCIGAISVIGIISLLLLREGKEDD